MALALGLGRRGMGRVWPNPAVGCVIVQDGRVVGRGWTADGGRPHAETQALAQAGARASQAIAYVTLEPCAHKGQTPPCASALIAAGVARVVIACTDPDPRVAGKGAQMLRDAGIEVTQGVREAEALRDHQGFFARLRGKPFVTLKIAATIDGRIATATGESQWITGPQARRLVHAMRARHDAVMVGAGTVRADDPMLTVRDMGPIAQPVRVVVSRGLDLPLGGRLMASAGDVPVWMCHAGAPREMVAAFEGLGAEGLECGLRGGQVDLAQAMTVLAKRGLTRIFCEGGGALAAGLLAQDLVDELVVFTAPKAIGAEGLASLGRLGLDRLAQAPQFERGEVRPIGADIMTRWHRQR